MIVSLIDNDFNNFEITEKFDPSNSDVSKQISRDTCNELFSRDSKTIVQMEYPEIFEDSRGKFFEVMTTVGEGVNLPSVKQINRSFSKPGTLRGFHAQTGASCQGKLVESLNFPIIDILIDARPDSKTFSHMKWFVLSPEKQNRLWVPRGFLHGFIVPTSVKEYPNFNDLAIFQYYCDNVYDNKSEICINPMSVLPETLKNNPHTAYSNEIEDEDIIITATNDIKSEKDLIISEKDLKGEDFDKWMEKIYKDFHEKNIRWYEL